MSNLIKSILTLNEHLVKNNIKFGFTGSTSLYATGNLDREINDIDIVISSDSKKKFLNLFNTQKCEKSKEYPNQSYLVKVEWDGFNVDVFHKNDSFFKIFTFDSLLDGSYIKLYHPSQSIAAKNEYLSHYKNKLVDHKILNNKELSNFIKHIKDVNYYNSKNKVEKYTKNDDLPF